MADEMECPCCKTKVYKSKRYLKCHLAYPSNTRCKAVWEGHVLGILDHTSAAGNKPAHEAMNAPSDGNESACDEFVSCESLSLSSADGNARKSDHDSCCVFTLPVDDEEEDNGYGTYNFDEEEGKQEEEEDSDSPDRTIMHELKDYIAHFSSHTCNLTPDDCAGIELLDILIKQRAPMRIFDDIYR